MRRVIILALVIILLVTFTSCNRNEMMEETVNTPEVKPSQTQNKDTMYDIKEFDLQEIFASEDLISQIEYYLGKNKDITEEDLKNIKEITFQNYNDIPIKGIEYLTNVETLIFKNSQLEDFSTVATLANLKEFEIHCMEIEDLNPLLNSKMLGNLNIYANSIADTSALREMNNLEILEIDFEDVNVDTLIQIPNLKKLIVHIDKEDKNEKLVELNQLENIDVVLDLSNYSSNDLTIISELRNVKGIILDDAFISDCSILLEFEELQMISANYSGIGDDMQFTKVVEQIPSLTHIYIEYSGVYDLNFVKALPNLKELNISQMENCIDFSPLNEAVNLEKLVINGSLYGIEEIGFLKEMDKLVSLDLALNEIKNIDDLSGNINLTHLNLYFNNIEDITAISSLTELTELYLDGNYITDISAVGDLKYLTELTLSDNQIIDISPISNLTNLETLYLKNNQIEDISVIRNLNTLTYINIDGNPIGNIEILEELGFESKGDGAYYRYLNNPD